MTNNRKLPDILKRSLERGFEAGIGSFIKSEGVIKGVLAEGKLPRELSTFVLGQLEETKDAVLRIVAKEVRNFLSAKDVSKELKKTLSGMTLQITTEIRFVPSADDKDPVPKMQKTRLTFRKRRKQSATR